MINQRIRTACAAGLALLFLVCFAPTAHAADNGEWSVDPTAGDGPATRSNFNYTLKPEQIFRDSVTVANVSDETLTLDLYPTDAFNTPLDSGFALLEEDEPPIDVGTWIELATSQVTLEPQTAAEIPFSITIPLDAQPGDHAGGIIAQNANFEPQADPEGDVGVQIRRRVATRVYVRVDGPLEPDLQVTQVSVDHTSALFPPFTGTGRAAIGYEIKNTGNTRINPTSEVKVEGILGGTKIEFETRELNELLPGSSVIVSEFFEGLPGLNRLTVKVDVSGTGPFGDTAESSGSTTFWVVSWLSVLWLLLIPILFVFWRRERRRPSSPQDDPQSPGPVEELVDA